MALRNSFREAPRLLREQLLLSVPMTAATVHQTPRLFLETIPPLVSPVGADEHSSQSNATTADRCSDGFVNPYPSH